MEKLYLPKFSMDQSNELWIEFEKGNLTDEKFCELNDNII